MSDELQILGDGLEVTWTQAPCVFCGVLTKRTLQKYDGTALKWAKNVCSDCFDGIRSIARADDAQGE